MQMTQSSCSLWNRTGSKRRPKTPSRRNSEASEGDLVCGKAAQKASTVYSRVHAADTPQAERVLLAHAEKLEATSFESQDENRAHTEEARDGEQSHESAVTAIGIVIKHAIVIKVFLQVGQHFGAHEHIVFVVVCVLRVSAVLMRDLRAVHSIAKHEEQVAEALYVYDSEDSFSLQLWLCPGPKPAHQLREEERADAA
eukprot:CAMPEP_0185574612 /NCGR_PEP_ID=MMETSP0434-20130131/6038_1 /TAXON_ID=626734 ORGANISM="Favella taraikaensis, Strain Fe Narragansett Bay" /NCGR_SAMPLE_ID=MMETSP0434 /ASSEMBLY_ACC=CAM_ASM_000379 /LENGTH=197 /DNA_ID=CAMNT_0028191247 /DNA_START=317 /DNA_END=909 /DNA_ORIENTATION=+